MLSLVASSSCSGGIVCNRCRGVRDSSPRASGRGASADGVRQVRSVVSPNPDELRFFRGSVKAAEIKRPLLRLIRSCARETTGCGVSFAPGDDAGRRPTSSLEALLPPRVKAFFAQRVLDRWVHDLPREFSTSFYFRGLVASILTSIFFSCTPTADAISLFPPRVAGNAAPVSAGNVSNQDMQDSEAFRARVTAAIDLLEKGQSAQARGEFCKALDFYEEVKQTAGDLALAEYARVGHAVTLYEVGDRSEAITEMEDVSIALRGYPEIHAALAAALYVDKHAAMPAEKQFNIATLLDPRYTNLKWVQENKHWPPSLLNSLKLFISLQ
ncbi:hypothetical protein MPTK1_4g07230 [Marchantia polymorpha subsp. ruderalis]|uniref:Uncharacterized protein n=2 Tax=Marchantia polymorpha TaxID=3197 RepID=A0A176VRX2_MARPO|nr:hypothetical protein AXG93_1544s1180 [Marchantia polymorpha subsp. ruderalis]PTQ31142.1 hypothetical protein MARPO_0115s0058 [Marchantia polymorpha]BBN07912.1 hypothetical protein Mp_4g07230 [Marchantia polymorpha subsp. ruderalis]|eukprot:PTQ31142.1 hypothetical protein MARPO_0115s0058 [Marchantia polymorpha]